MARTTSIFYNIQARASDVPEERCWSLEEIRSSSYLPNSYRDLLKKLYSDLTSIRIATVSLNDLFIILNWKKKALNSLPTNELFTVVRSLLKKQAHVEFAPPGNFQKISINTEFLVCPEYNLSNDPDIVAAKNYIGHKNTNALVMHRTRIAQSKINNFLILIHVFEALWVATYKNELSSEQRLYIKDLLANALLPDEGKLYLKYCLSCFVEQKLLTTELMPDKCYLKPLPEGSNRDEFLTIMAKIAALSDKPLDFDDKEIPYVNELTAKYQLIRSQLPDRSQKFSPLPYQPIIKNIHSPLDDLIEISSKHIYGESTKVRKEFLNKVLSKCKEIGFVNSDYLVFYDKKTLYLSDIAIPNAYIYFDNRTKLDNNFWTFAATERPRQPLIQHEKYKTITEMDEPGRRMFAISLEKPDERQPGRETYSIITGNLEYRLLVEGLLGTITANEKSHAFSWLVQWYLNAFINNDSLMKDFRDVLKAMGDALSLSLYFWPDEETTSVRNIFRFHPNFDLYAQIRLAELITNDEISKANQTDLLFQAFIVSDDAFNIDIRISGKHVALLYNYANTLFRENMLNNPEEYRKIISGLSVSKTRKFMHKDLFQSLRLYKNNVISQILPKLLQVSDEAEALIKKNIASIKKNAHLLMTYLNSTGKSLNNEITYRIWEYGISENRGALPNSLQVFKDTLVEVETRDFNAVKQMFGLTISSRATCLSIIEKCAEFLRLSMYPNSTYEQYNNVVSGFAYISFRKHELPKIEVPGNILLCYRLALDAATIYSIQTHLYLEFEKYLNSSNIEMQTKEALLDYARAITYIKQSKGGGFRPGANIGSITFTDEEKELLKRFIALIAGSGDWALTSKNISTINNRIKDDFLNGFVKAGKASSGASSYLGRVSSWVTPQTSSNHVTLDKELIREKTMETNKVQEILVPIFADSDADEATPTRPATLQTALGKTDSEKTDSPQEIPPTDLSDLTNDERKISGKAIFNLLPQNCRQLLLRLCQLGDFSEEDFRKNCREFGLMSEGALEIINNWALQNFDCTLIEIDDPMFLDRDILNDLLQE